jgi:hypothetical protein
MGDLAAARSLILQIAQRKSFDVAELVAAIEILEQQQKTQPISHELAELAGQWQLLWTSGTQKYQQLRAQIDRPNGNSPKQAKIKDNIWQSFDLQLMQITNQVKLPFGAIEVSGSFGYSAKNRVEFNFSQVSFKIGNLPARAIPLNWLKNTQGWLQTTYLDSQIHIERGDRGGVSVFIKLL